MALCLGNDSLMLFCYCNEFVVFLNIGLPANGVEKLSNSSLTMPYGMSFYLVSHNYP